MAGATLAGCVEPTDTLPRPWPRGSNLGEHGGMAEIAPGELGYLPGVN